MDANETVRLDEPDREEQKKLKTLLGAVAIMVYINSVQLSVLSANVLSTNITSMGPADLKMFEAARQQRALLLSAMNDALQLDLPELTNFESTINPLLDAIAKAQSMLRDEKP